MREQVEFHCFAQGHLERTCYWRRNVSSMWSLLTIPQSTNKHLTFGFGAFTARCRCCLMCWTETFAAAAALDFSTFKQPCPHIHKTFHIIIKNQTFFVSFPNESVFFWRDKTVNVLNVSLSSVYVKSISNSTNLDHGLTLGTPHITVSVTSCQFSVRTCKTIEVATRPQSHEAFSGNPEWRDITCHHLGRISQLCCCNLNLLGFITISLTGHKQDTDSSKQQVLRGLL